MSEEIKASEPVRRRQTTFPPLKTPKWMQGFVDFVREQGVVGLAIGLTLGIASKTVVDSLVNNIFNPVIGVLLGGESLNTKSVCLKSVNGVCTSNLAYGQVLSDMLNFVIIAAIIYFVIKGLKLDKFDKKKVQE